MTKTKTFSFSRLRELMKRLGFGPRSALLLVGLSLCSAIFEVFGVGIFLPIFQYVRLDGNETTLLQESSFWGSIHSVASYINVDISIGIMLLAAFFFFSLRQVFMYLRLYFSASIRTRMIKSSRDSYSALFTPSS